ncbi:MAG TPA: dual specificity protein phosphatase family protein [Fimbriimonas sp.]|nr:dual specificity protein phosphatase family protein [Fimbriimonas sp.]
MQKITKLWWIERDGQGRLGIMSRPNCPTLADDLKMAKDAGAHEIISLLTTDEVGSHELEGEAEAARALGLKFKRYGIQDHGVPTVDAGLNDFLKAVAKDLKAGKSVLVHCNSGKGRSGLIAGALMAMEGVEVDHAIKAMRAARHSRVPENDEQEQWLRDFAAQYHPLTRADDDSESEALTRLRVAVVVGLVAVLGAAAYLGWLKSRKESKFMFKL